MTSPAFRGSYLYDTPHDSDVTDERAGCETRGGAAPTESGRLPDAGLVLRETPARGIDRLAAPIQSRNYKAVEATCRLPDQARLDSPAYQSVPEIRERVLAGQRNLADALGAAVGSGLLAPAAQAAVHAAMERFEGAIFKWRKTHHRLAVRMLGERRGTGYTAGVDYLEEGRTIPVFKARCPFGHGSADESRVTDEVLAEAA